MQEHHSPLLPRYIKEIVETYSTAPPQRIQSHNAERIVSWRVEACDDEKSRLNYDTAYHRVSSLQEAIN